jgi:hypothetical protein
LTDGNGMSDEISFTIQVHNVNDPPVITTENVLVALEDTEYSVNYTALDIDPTDDVLTWERDTDADWLTLDDTLLHGTPTNDDVGKYTVLITVKDGNGGSDSTQFRLEVVNVNDAPYWFTVPGNTTIEEGETLILECLARDVDNDDVILYSISSSPVSSITITNLSGIIRWEDPRPGTYSVRISATDGNATIQHSFTLFIRPQDIKREDESTSFEPNMPLILCLGLSVIAFLVIILIVALLMLMTVRNRNRSEEE